MQKFTHVKDGVDYKFAFLICLTSSNLVVAGLGQLIPTAY